ncbi:hypothetical protein BD289DRAFT_480245 [Coniella lustricola]|uniref:Uncharacterized protein n=1 Tax=Coniella lustricola TaxID=2025994 RepID=A0A2T3AGD0_9PEZI|nr:hypothetical protein BD289DRAFT_480245 [Coniella lustricola]
MPRQAVRVVLGRGGSSAAASSIRRHQAFSTTTPRSRDGENNNGNNNGRPSDATRRGRSAAAASALGAMSRSAPPVSSSQGGQGGQGREGAGGAAGNSGGPNSNNSRTPAPAFRSLNLSRPGGAGGNIISLKSLPARAAGAAPRNIVRAPAKLGGAGSGAGGSGRFVGRSRPGDAGADSSGHRSRSQYGEQPRQGAGTGTSGSGFSRAPGAGRSSGAGQPRSGGSSFGFGGGNARSPRPAGAGASGSSGFRRGPVGARAGGGRFGGARAGGAQGRGGKSQKRDGDRRKGRDGKGRDGKQETSQMDESVKDYEETFEAGGLDQPYKPRTLSLKRLLGHGPAVATNTALGQAEIAIRNMRIIAGGRGVASIYESSFELTDIKRWRSAGKPIMFSNLEQKKSAELMLAPGKLERTAERIHDALVRRWQVQYGEDYESFVKAYMSHGGLDGIMEKARKQARRQFNQSVDDRQLKRTHNKTTRDAIAKFALKGDHPEIKPATDTWSRLAMYAAHERSYRPMDAASLEQKVRTLVKA